MRVSECMRVSEEYDECWRNTMRVSEAYGGDCRRNTMRVLECMRISNECSGCVRGLHEFYVTSSPYQQDVGGKINLKTDGD